MVNKRGNGFSFSIVELINAITTVIENSYIKFNSKVYKQIIGIPMGTNCAPPPPPPIPCKYISSQIRKGIHQLHFNNEYCLQSGTYTVFPRKSAPSRMSSPPPRLSAHPLSLDNKYLIERPPRMSAPTEIVVLQ